ncbi:uncharacterized protein [Aquarana catesbeiana]|uniref:uncharacterized protein n=1 Tax=Aquarana catesbeiana TaxID=8400 RepID=UPI003CC99B5A
MKNLCLWILIILLSLQSYVMSEAPSVKEDVLGAVGGAVTLHLCYTGATSITWNLVKRGITIARTKPQESPEIEDSRYDGRLSSTPDGSLIITELRLEDQGDYRAQSRIDKEIKTCDYHLTVFSNLTAEDVTINSNVTDNETCEVSLTCLVDSVDRRNVTIIWRSLNSSNVTQTENVVFVPPSNINFTYICTAMNPVSNASKNAVPWLYCNNNPNINSRIGNGISKEIKAIIIIVVLVLVAILLALAWFFIKKEKKSEDVNKEKAALKQIANTYEMSDEDCTGNNEALVDENAGSETTNVKQPMKGTAGMSKNPQTTELQESQSNETTDKTVYSTVQHVKEPQESQSNFTTSNTVYSTVQLKQKNNQTKQPSPSKGNPPKAPLKPTRQVLESPMDKNKQKSPSERPNGNCSNPPLESCYAEVQLPKEKMAPLESCYSEVHEPQKETKF